jgi:hypothetical protein
VLDGMHAACRSGGCRCARGLLRYGHALMGAILLGRWNREKAKLPLTPA